MLDYLKSRGTVFAIQPYRFYILNCMLSMLGNGLTFVVTAWIVLAYQSGIMPVMILIMCSWLPMLILSPVAGVIADRFDRKTVIIVTNFLRGILIVLLLFYAGEHLSVHIIYLIGLVNGLLASVYAPAAMALVREIVPADELLSANATVDMAYETGNLSGMALAGLVLATLGGVAALYLNAGLFILAGFSAMLMRRSDFVNLKRAATMTQGFFADFVAGLQYIMTHRKTLMLYVLQLIMICTWMSAPVIMAPYAKTILHATVTEFGYIEACMGIGLLIGGVLTPWLKEKCGFFNTVLLYSLLQILGFILLSFFTNLILSEILYAFIGFGFTIWAVIMTEAQNRTDLDFQGRVQSTFFSLSGLFVMVIYGLLAFIGDAIALQYVFMIEVVLLLLGIALLFWVRRSQAC